MAGLVIKTTGIEDYLDGGEAYVKALIMGPPSSGKTRSASFWPKPIFADCEKGRMSIADRKVPYGEIVTTEDMKTLIRTLKVECMKPVANRRYQTLVIDTLDAYQRIVIQERLAAEKKEALSGWADWGYLDAKMSALVADLISLPMNIVVNVHTKEHSEGEGDSKASVTGVKLKGDLKDQIAAEFDLVGLMGVFYEAEEGERVLKRAIKWHPEPTAPMLKDRSGSLPRFTDVTFTETDYTGLLEPLRQAMEALTASEDVEVLAYAEGPAPVAPAAGGAVAAPTPAPAKKAAAPAKAAPAKAVPTAVPAAPPAPVPPKVAVPAAPRPTIEVVDANVPSGAESAPAPGTTTPVEGAQANTETGELPTEPVEQELTPEEIAASLGGTVIEDPQVPDDEADSAAAVDPDDGAGDGPAETAQAAPVAPACGTAGPNLSAGQDPVPGCGKSLADENRDIVNIGFIQTNKAGRQTWLCAACIAAFKASA